MKTIMSGNDSQDPNTELMAQLAQEMYNSNTLLLLVQNLAKVEFEVRMLIFRSLSYFAKEP